MSFRTIVVKERCKLDLKFNHLVCRGEKEIKVFIPEISVLILESTTISITTALISELTKNNVKIIFSDEKHNPESELLPIYGAHNSSKQIAKQIGWAELDKQRVWTEIIRFKITKQMNFLKELCFYKEAIMLEKYLSELEFYDKTNREGHSAKVYFNALWGMDFSRKKFIYTNLALNYGYAVLLSCFNREIVSKGYLTQLGIWHKNEFNQFNLASDLMEPFRIIIDKIVYDLQDNDEDYKCKILNMFNLKFKINGIEYFLENVINIYLQSIFDSIETGDISLIRIYE